MTGCPVRVRGNLAVITWTGPRLESCVRKVRLQNLNLSFKEQVTGRRSERRTRGAKCRIVYEDVRV